MKKKKIMLQTKSMNRRIAWVAACALIVSLFSCMGPMRGMPAQAAVTLHNPTYDSGVREVEPGMVDAAGNIHNPVYDADTDTAIWDCVWFGNYWQSDTNGDGVADENDDKEPIKWRVLSVDGDDVFLMADKNLDVKPYNETDTDVTWETCTLRSWLNGYSSDSNVCGTDYTSDNFIDAAFTVTEQAEIKTADVVNEDNPEYGTEGGKDTKDKVYLLSIGETSNQEYGFKAEFDEDTDIRRAANTAFVADTSEWMNPAGTAGGQWLRSPGNVSNYAAYVNGCGACYGSHVYYDDCTIRPTLHLTLSSFFHLTYAGTTTSTWEGSATWDCVYFGNYRQTDTNGDGKADTNDAKEPIKWRVLSVNGDDVFLLADKNLDAKPYNTMHINITWEKCTLRSWLNGYDSDANAYGTDYTTDNFVDEAFTATERAVIKTTDVVNADNPYYGTEGGNNTKDMVYLLSVEEVSREVYGFHRIYWRESGTRVALNTTYAEEQGADTATSHGSGWWWLRSPGVTSDCAAYMTYYGDGYDDGDSWYVSADEVAIRPALHLTLSSSTPITYAGTVSSDGTETDADGSIVAKPTPPLTSGRPTERPISTSDPSSPFPRTTMTPGQVIKDTATKAFYQIISTGTANAEVSYVRPNTKTKKAKVPAVIYHGGKKYKVTSVAAKAFAGNKKLKSVVIGKNVKKIQKKAFANCKKLSKVTVKSKVLSKVAKNAFRGTNKKLTVKVPKKKRAKYRRLFKRKGNKTLKVK